MVKSEVVAAGMMMIGVRDGRLPPAPEGGRAAVTGRSSRRPGVLPPIDPFSGHDKIKH